MQTANVLLDDADNPKVADFGTAYVGNDRTRGDVLTHKSTRVVTGTPGYMPPVRRNVALVLGLGCTQPILAMACGAALPSSHTYEAPRSSAIPRRL
jgi:hypothetical protein